MPPSTVLILAAEKDATADHVAAELASRAVPVLRTDTADFPARLTLAAALDGRGTWGGSLRAADGTGRSASVELDDIRSVYYRHPGQFRLPGGMSPPERAFAFNEARRGFGGVLHALGCLWVNHPVRAAAAEYKPVQLREAVASGLRVPDSIITNDAAEARDWAAAQGRPVIYKPLSGVWHPEENKIKIVYTSRVDDLAALHEGGIEHTAHLFQAWIDKAYEARAVVVGDQVFTTAIHAGSEAGHVDWRADYDSHRYETVEPPDDVRDSLVRLHRRLGLAFGACDLAVTPEDEWVFFETNQAGQWAWLADYGAEPVAGALADLLQEGRDSDRSLCI